MSDEKLRTPGEDAWLDEIMKASVGFNVRERLAIVLRAYRANLLAQEPPAPAYNAELITNSPSGRTVEERGAFVAAPPATAGLSTEQAGRIMHQSWCETKRKQGFHHPNECPARTNFEVVQNLKPLHLLCKFCHFDLRPWEELPEEQKEINRHAFDALSAAKPADAIRKDGWREGWDTAKALYEQREATLRKDVLEEVRVALSNHWLAGIHCHHAVSPDDQSYDRASCACSRVNLASRPTVGEAVGQWVAHVLGTLNAAPAPAGAAPSLDSQYAAYANHCAIEGKVAESFHSWKRAGAAKGDNDAQL